MTASPDRRVAELVERAARPLGVERFGFCPLEALDRKSTRLNSSH